MIRSAHQTTQPTPWRKEVRKALLCYMKERNISFDIVSYPTTFGAFLQPISYCALLSNILVAIFCPKIKTNDRRCRAVVVCFSLIASKPIDWV